MNNPLTLLIFSFSLISLPHIITPLEDDNVVLTAIEFIKTQIMISLTEAIPQISQKCNSSIYNAINHPDHLYMIKLLKDSAKNSNDLGSYLECFSNNYRSFSNSSTKLIKDNLTYITIRIKNDTYDNCDIRHESRKPIFGACVPRGCSTEEYKMIFASLNNATDMFSQVNLSDISVYDMKADQENFHHGMFFVNMIPIYILIAFLLMNIFPCIPVSMFKCCFKKKLMNINTSIISTGKLEDNIHHVEDKNVVVIYDIPMLNRFRSCFSINDNVEEIMTTDISMHDMNVSNDSGLSVIRGLRGVMMIFLVIGMTFEHLYYSPVKFYYEYAFMNFIRNLSFSFVLFCKRFGVVSMYAISGFVLIYKLLCYLDSEVEKMDIPDESEDQGQLNDPFMKKPGTNIDDTRVSKGHFNISQSLTLALMANSYLQSSRKMSYKSLLSFISLQVHKYLILVLTLLIYCFSFHDLISALYDSGPVWIYLKEAIIQPFKASNIPATLFLYANFTFPTLNVYNPFWILLNEISFFLFGSALVFVFYKKNWRLDLFLVILSVGVLLLKLGFFLCLYFPEGPLSVGQYRYYPSRTFHDGNWGFVRKNPIGNLSCFLIGMFFGMINYCIQKSISMENLAEEMKRFLYCSCVFLLFFKKNRMVKILTISITSGAFLVLLMFAFCMMVNYCFDIEKDNMVSFFQHWAVNVFFLYDMELASVLLFMILIPLFLAGDNFLILFLKHDYWSFISRPYYMFILLHNLVIFLIFYQSESRVNLEFVNILFFSLLGLMMILVISAVGFIFYEVPLKKLNKLIVHIIIGRYKEGGENENVTMMSKAVTKASINNRKK